jgi:hypothetical protein
VMGSYQIVNHLAYVKPRERSVAGTMAAGVCVHNTDRKHKAHEGSAFLGNSLDKEI